MSLNGFKKTTNKQTKTEKRKAKFKNINKITQKILN